MDLLRKVSIRNKIIMIIMLVCSLIIVFGFTIVFISNVFRMKKDMVNSANMNAKLIGEYCVTALSFQYPDRAEEILEKLNSIPEILNGYVYDENGSLFASYNKAGETPVLPPINKGTFHRFDGDYLHVWEPIVFMGKTHGTIYLKAFTSLTIKIRNHIILILSLILGLLIVSYLFAAILQRIISRPILKLAEISENISSKGDYSLRAEKKSEDEIGVLYDEFNTMLDQIIMRQEEKNKAETERGRLSEILETTSDLVSIAKPSAQLIYMNRAGREMLGWGSDENVRPKTNTDVHPEWAFKIIEKECIPATIESGMWKGETALLGSDGNEIPVSQVIMSHKSEDGKLEYISTIMRDITERKVAEKALKESHDKLEEKVEQRTKELSKAKEEAEVANKTKSEFLANMSHEIRTPLNAILGYSQLMSHDLSLTSEQKENLNTINRSGRHLLALINEILELSKIEAHHLSLAPVHFDLHQMLDDLRAMFKVRTDAKDLQFSVLMDKELPRYIFCDEGKLRQIFINIIGNAVKFTKTGGIEVRTKFADANKPRLIVEVEDTGIGIAQKDQERIFQSFEQTTNILLAEGSTGLGLAISLGYARLMGGDITVTSKESKGSLFRLEISVENGKEITGVERAVVQRITGLTPAQRVPTVLIVDDKKSNRDLLMKLLAAVGYKQLLAAANGREAIDLFESRSPDLILMDIKMPVMDGYEAIRNIRNSNLKNKNVPIIAVSASAFEEDRKKIISAGADDLIRKPFQESEIFESIRQHLGVEYLYEEEGGEKVDRFFETAVKEAPKTFAGLPVELLKEIKVSALQGEVHSCMSVIEKIRPMNARAAVALEEFVKNYQFDKLYDVVLNEIAAHRKEEHA
jgi:PAS domain S-box-containing protein